MSVCHPDRHLNSAVGSVFDHVPARQEERWHESADFPSDSAEKTNVFLFLGGTEQHPPPTKQTVPGVPATKAQKKGGGAATIHHAVSAEGVDERGEGRGGSEKNGRVLASGGGDAAADGGGGEAKRGVRGRLSSRLASWPSFRKHRVRGCGGGGRRLCSGGGVEVRVRYGFTVAIFP